MTEPTILLFECARRPSLRLTATSCAGMWNKARRMPNGSIDAAMKCRGCQVGAGHAGMSPDMSRELKGEDKRCTRCRRAARKLIYGDLCLSCYNRQTELRRGINRLRTRGKIFWPKYARPLRLAVVMVRVADDAPSGRQVSFDLVADGLEVALRSLRRSRTDIAIGFSRPLEPDACAGQ